MAFWLLLAAEAVAAFALALAVLETLVFHLGGQIMVGGSYWEIWSTPRLTLRERLIVIFAFGLTAMVGLRLSAPHEPSYPWLFEVLVGLFATAVTLFFTRFGLRHMLRPLEIGFALLVGIGSVALLLVSGEIAPFLFLLWLILAVTITRFLNHPEHGERPLSQIQYEEFLKDLFWISFILALALVLYPRLDALPQQLGKAGSELLLLAILFVAIATVIFEFVSLWRGSGRANCEELFEVLRPGEDITDVETRHMMRVVDRHIMIRDAVLLLGLVVGTFALFLVWELTWT